MEHPLAQKRGLVKQIVVEIADSAAIGIKAAQAAEQPGKGAGRAGRELRLHPWLQDSVALCDDFPPLVHLRLIHGVEHGPHQLIDSVHSEDGVAVQDQQQLGIPQ